MSSLNIHLFGNDCRVFKSSATFLVYEDTYVSFRIEAGFTGAIPLEEKITIPTRRQTSQVKTRVRIDIFVSGRIPAWADLLI